MNPISSSSSAKVDESIMNTATPTGLNGVSILCNSVSKGTNEVKNLLYNECDVILECKICRNLFRSVPNFIAHKRSYCRASAADAVRQQLNINNGSVHQIGEDNGLDRPRSTESCPNLSPTATSPENNASTSKSVNSGNGDNRSTNATAATKITFNFLNRLTKRMDACVAEASKTAGGDSDTPVIPLHSLPTITKIVPYTTFEKGVQVITNPWILDKIPSKEYDTGNSTNGDGAANNDLPTYTMVIPQDAAHRLHGMELRTRRHPDPSLAVKEISKRDHEIYERLASKCAQRCDLSTLQCLECKKMFKRLDILAFHMTCCHIDQPAESDLVMCYLCGGRYSVPDIHDHASTVHKSVSSQHEEEISLKTLFQLKKGASRSDNVIIGRDNKTSGTDNETSAQATPENAEVGEKSKCETDKTPSADTGSSDSTGSKSLTPPLDSSSGQAPRDVVKKKRADDPKTTVTGGQKNVKDPKKPQGDVSPNSAKGAKKKANSSAGVNSDIPASEGSAKDEDSVKKTEKNILEPSNGTDHTDDGSTGRSPIKGKEDEREKSNENPAKCGAVEEVQNGQDLVRKEVAQSGASEKEVPPMKSGRIEKDVPKKRDDEQVQESTIDAATTKPSTGIKAAGKPLRWPLNVAEKKLKLKSIGPGPKSSPVEVEKFSGKVDSTTEDSTDQAEESQEPITDKGPELPVLKNDGTPENEEISLPRSLPPTHGGGANRTMRKRTLKSPYSTDEYVNSWPLRSGISGTVGIDTGRGHVTNEKEKGGKSLASSANKPKQPSASSKVKVAKDQDEGKTSSKTQEGGEKSASTAKGAGEKSASNKAHGVGVKPASKAQGGGGKSASKAQGDGQKSAPKAEEGGEKSDSSSQEVGEMSTSKTQGGETSASKKQEGGEKSASKKEEGPQKPSSKKKGSGKKSGLKVQGSGGKSESKSQEGRRNSASNLTPKEPLFPVYFTAEQREALDTIICRKTFACLKCNTTFCNLPNCERHCYSHFGYVRFKCVHCDVASFYRTDLRCHLRRDCPMVPDKTVSPAELNKYIIPVCPEKPGAVAMWKKQKEKEEEECNGQKEEQDEQKRDQDIPSRKRKLPSTVSGDSNEDEQTEGKKAKKLDGSSESPNVDTDDVSAAMERLVRSMHALTRKKIPKQCSPVSQISTAAVSDGNIGSLEGNQ